MTAIVAANNPIEITQPFSSNIINKDYCRRLNFDNINPLFINKLETIKESESNENCTQPLKKVKMLATTIFILLPRTTILSTGEKYEGDLSDNLPHGRGLSWDPKTNQPIYKGNWTRGLPHGYGEKFTTLQSLLNCSSKSLAESTHIASITTSFVEFQGIWFQGNFKEGSQFSPQGLLRYKGFWSLYKKDSNPEETENHYQGFLHPQFELIKEQSTNDKNDKIFKPQARKVTPIKTKFNFALILPTAWPR